MEDVPPEPKLFDNEEGPDPDNYTRHLLSHLVSLEEWDRFDALAATIPGAPEDSSLALFRDMKLTQKLDEIRQHEQAVALRSRLFPLAGKAAKRDAWEAGELIESHVSDLVRSGKGDEARPLANRYIADLPAAQREIHIGQFIYNLHAAGLKIGDVRKFFDEDVLNLPRVQGRLSARTRHTPG